jgi:hypothetical protein
LGIPLVELCWLKNDVAGLGAILFLHVQGDWDGPSRIGSLVKYTTETGCSASWRR